MRAMVFDRYGEPDVISLREAPVPEPQDGEVLVRGVNPSDSNARAGYRLRGVDFPFVTGMDAAGVVERTRSMREGSRESLSKQDSGRPPAFWHSVLHSNALISPFLQYLQVLLRSNY